MNEKTAYRRPTPWRELTGDIIVLAVFTLAGVALGSVGKILTETVPATIRDGLNLHALIWVATGLCILGVTVLTIVPILGRIIRARQANRLIIPAE